MNSRFWFHFFIFTFICLLIAFLAGFFLTTTYSTELERALLKKSLKLESFSYLEQLNKRLDFLIREGERVQSEEKLPSDSPFFAFVVLSNLPQGEKVYVVESQIPLNITDQKQNVSVAKKQFEEKSHFDLEKKKTLIELSRKAAVEPAVEGFWFKSLQATEQKQSFIVFIKSLGKNKRWIAFLKEDKKFFKLWPKEAKHKGREVFVINGQGKLFFHTKEKTLAKESSVWKSLKKISKKPFSKGKYLESHRKSGDKNMYYLQKWGKGDLFLISKAKFSLPFFAWRDDSYLIALGVCFLIFCLFFSFFCLKLFRLLSAYDFLKKAILSFDKTNLFPIIDIPKNPLLYFYRNRSMFLNKKEEMDKNDKTKLASVNFQEIIRQELEKLKSKFPKLIVREEFDFDVKLFGFERFLRAIVHELLLNALESMGGSKEQKLDLSLKKEEVDLIFSIRDYGTGVDDKNYKKCFHMYYSTKSQMGVGLNLVQSIVQSNEGDIEFSSPKEGGLKVHVRLPLKCFLKNNSDKQKSI